MNACPVLLDLNRKAVDDDREQYIQTLADDIAFRIKKDKVIDILCDHLGDLGPKSEIVQLLADTASHDPETRKSAQVFLAGKVDDLIEAYAQVRATKIINDGMDKVDA